LFDKEKVRTFQHFLWKDLPQPNFPLTESGQPYFSEETRQKLRLSSKTHLDLPVLVGPKTLHFLVAHPTPPVFDGPEDRNGKRNYDEIRFWANYISDSPENTYHIDDSGGKGGLSSSASFVFAGDLNADPDDGDSYANAIWQLLDKDFIHREVANGPLTPRSKGAIEHLAANERFKNQKGDQATKTSFWGLRVDYLLPSKNLEVTNSYVFWPEKNEATYRIVEKTSDHLPVFLEVMF